MSARDDFCLECGVSNDLHPAPELGEGREEWECQVAISKANLLARFCIDRPSVVSVVGDAGTPEPASLRDDVEQAIDSELSLLGYPYEAREYLRRQIAHAVSAGLDGSH